MDSRQEDTRNPAEKSSIFSRVFLWWVVKLITHGYKYNITQGMLYEPRFGDRSEYLGDKLQIAWEREICKAGKSSSRPSLSRAICRVFLPSYSAWGILAVFQIFVVNTGLPFILAKFVSYYSDDSTMTYREAHIYALLMTMLSFVCPLSFNHTLLGTSQIGMRVRIACCSLIYRKILKMNKLALGQIAAGQIVNLMSNDVNRFDTASVFLHYLWIAPIYTVFLTYLMWSYVGIASLAGTIVIIIQSIILQGVLSTYQAKMRGKIAKLTDNRVKLMSELVNGIQVIKMYAWESPFANIVAKARRLEMKYITITSIIRGFSTGVMVFTERLTLFVTVVTFTLLGGYPQGSIVFALAQYYNMLQMVCTILFPMGLVTLGEAMISVRRIEDALLLDEMTEQQVTSNGVDEKGSTMEIVVKNATAGWNMSSPKPTLLDINLSLKPGSFYAVVGLVGSGKSSLLQLLIGELPVREGSFQLNGLTVSYAAQEPWLFVGTVKENILFGETFDEKRYIEVVNACDLWKDFNQFSKGDNTLVGERGASLSGGQRARISLARAVYRKGDLYLLDDPLSAVDTHVGKHLMRECVEGFLKEKTRILVTHQLHHLKNADKIIILNGGVIEAEGYFHEVYKNELYSHLLERDDNEKKMSDEIDTVDVDFKSSNSSLSKLNGETTSLTHKQVKSNEDEDIETNETEELIAKGRISSTVFKHYFTAGVGKATIVVFVILAILTQVLTSMGDLWLSHWINVEEIQYAQRIRNISKENVFANSPILFENTTGNLNNVSTSNENSYLNISTVLSGHNHAVISPDAYFLVYSTLTSIEIWAVFISFCIVFTSIRAVMFMWMCAKSSIGLHEKMFKNVLHATMRFFDTNPSGRILNRFSKDMGSTDEFLPRPLMEALQIAMVLCGILAMVAIVNPYMLISTGIAGIALYALSMVYIKTAQDVKRLEGVTRSPVFSHITSTLDGLSTVRASNAQIMVRKQFDGYQDVHTSACYISLVANTAFDIWNSSLCAAFITAVIYSFLLLDDGTTKSGNVGLALSQALILLTMLQFGIKNITDVIAQMTSVERILQFTNLTNEHPLISFPGSEPPKNWPSKGRLEMKNVYLRYSEDTEPVLKNLNIVIESGWKVGVVGRTGAGKSSLIIALFRLGLVDGDIYIDDIDTSTIGLKDLRQKLSIIPQEPVLFSASLRYNLDPFNKHSDDAIWTALEDVEMKNSVSSLSHVVTEGGSNFSAGQRQLLCLARAALNENRILILDEATANVDRVTDALIQKSIRNRFSSCTVLTVAHRLHTVADSDRVLVMDSGQVVQYDHPHRLLNDKTGLFSKMVSQLGPAAEKELKRIASGAYEKYAEIHAE